MIVIVIHFQYHAAYATDTRNNATLPTGRCLHTYSYCILPVFDMQYYKLSTRAEKYWPLANDMSLNLKGTLGYADSYGDKKFPFFKNFFMGGPKTVRGYDQASIGEKTYNATTGSMKQLAVKNLSLVRQRFSFHHLA